MGLKNWWETKPEYHWLKYPIITGVIFLAMYNIAFWASFFSGEKCGGDMGCTGWWTIFFIPTLLITPVLMVALMVLPDINVVSMYIISSLGNFILGLIIGLIIWKIKNKRT